MLLGARAAGRGGTDPDELDVVEVLSVVGAVHDVLDVDLHAVLHRRRDGDVLVLFARPLAGVLRREDRALREALNQRLLSLLQSAHGP
jgi:hypothetical protein